MLTYIQQKHNISIGLLEKINTTALEKHMKSLKSFQRASIIKLYILNNVGILEIPNRNEFNV